MRAGGRSLSPWPDSLRPRLFAGSAWKTARKGAVLAMKAVAAHQANEAPSRRQWTRAKQRPCPSHVGSGNTQGQKHCPGHEGSRITRQTWCLSHKCTKFRNTHAKRQCPGHEGSRSSRQRRSLGCEGSETHMAKALSHSAVTAGEKQGKDSLLWRRRSLSDLQLP